MNNENRFLDVTQAEHDILKKVIERYFPNRGYEDILFKLIFDTKISKVKGTKYRLAYIKPMNQMNRFLTALEANREDGYDYCVVICKVLWDVIDEADKIRLLRHELNHVELVDGKNPYKTKDHDITEFYSDVEIESKPGGDIRWAERLGTILASIEEEEKEQKRQERKNKKKNKGE